MLLGTCSASAQPNFGFGIAELTPDRRGVFRGPVISGILLSGLVFAYIITVRVKLCMFQLRVWFIRDVVMSVSDIPSLMQRSIIRTPDICNF